MKQIMIILLIACSAFTLHAEDVFSEELEKSVDSVSAFALTTSVDGSFNSVDASKVYSLSDTLVVPDKNLVKPLLESLGVNLAVWGWDNYIGTRSWADVHWRHIKRNLKSNFVLDTDSYSGNQFSHPFHGSMFFNMARYHGNSYYVSMLYPLVGSITWEYFCETNRPSYNDFLSTGIGGSVIGEATHRSSDILFDNRATGFNRVVRELFGSLLNPARGAHRLFSGEMWRVAGNKGRMVESEPYTFMLGVNYRHQRELRGMRRSKDVGNLDFYLDYGDRFESVGKHKPFDYFNVHLAINIAENNPTFSDLDIRGRLYGWEFSGKHNWRYDFGIFQNYRYIDNYGGKGVIRAGNYPVISEACSFGVSFAARKDNAHSHFFNDVAVNGIGFGGTTADYFLPRYYNFASGFSVRHNISYSFHNVASIGNDFYFARMYVPHGGSDLNHFNDYYWGDEGNNSIFLNKSYLRLHINRNTQLQSEYTLYYRRSNYSYLPAVHAKSDEWRIGLLYSL